MKDRLIQLLDLEQLTPSKFADIIGVQRSSVSHVISGRNNPSFDFIQKTLRAFPGLNAEWLILGKGTMYEQMGRAAGGNLFGPPLDHVMSVSPEDNPIEGSDLDLPEDSQGLEEPESSQGDPVEHSLNQEDTNEQSPVIHSNEGKVVQVMVFYDNHTFRTYAPAK